MKKSLFALASVLAIAGSAITSTAALASTNSPLVEQGKLIQSCVQKGGVLGTEITVTGNTFSCHNSDGTVTQLFSVQKKE